MKKINCIVVFIILCLLLITTGCRDSEKIKLESLESLVNKEGLVFSITANINCVPAQLSIYENSKYEFRNSYKVFKDSEFVNARLIYNEPLITGIYDYDIIKIIQNSVITNKTLTYKIYTGSGEVYQTDNDNQYLTEFLKSINVNLDVCAEESY